MIQKAKVKHKDYTNLYQLGTILEREAWLKRKDKNKEMLQGDFQLLRGANKLLEECEEALREVPEIGGIGYNGAEQERALRKAEEELETMIDYVVEIEEELCQKTDKEFWHKIQAGPLEALSNIEMKDFKC